MISDIDRILPLILQEKRLNQRAQKQFLKLVKQIEKVKADDRSAEEWYVLGYAYEAQNNDIKAVEAYTESIKSDPDFEAAYKNRGSVFTRMKQFEDAEFDLEHALDLDPEFTPAKFQLAVLQTQKYEYDDAMLTLDEILEKQPDHLQSLAQKGTIFDKQGKYKEAIAAFDKVIEQEENDGNLFSQRAISKVFNNDPDGALEDFQKSQRLEGNNYITTFNLGLAYGLMQDKSKQAYQNFEKAFRKQPTLLVTYQKEAQEGEFTRLIDKLNQILTNLKNIDDDQPGKFYREELIDLLTRKLNEVSDQ
ncbi:MAG TPA: tetratricopeptide repeat protein [Balneolales bacterium]|nr:tetratricopeptide repeat protein [Balneolales bacterium]